MDADGSGAIDIEEIIEAFAVLGLTIEKETVSRLVYLLKGLRRAAPDYA